MKTISRNEDIPALTGLRFLAALAVAVTHGASLLLPLEGEVRPIQHWLGTLASFGMTLFFVLSGFVIHYNYRDQINSGGFRGFSRFVWARFARLYPLFFLVFLVDLLLGPNLYYFFAGEPTPIQPVLGAAPHFLLFVQSWTYRVIGEHSLIYQFGSSIPLTWSISTEWFFYLVYPLICFFLIRCRRPTVVVAATLAICAAWILVSASLFDRIPKIDEWAVGKFGPVAAFTISPEDSFARWLLYFSPYLRVGEFLIGCFGAQLFWILKNQAPGRKERFVGASLNLSAIASVPVLLYAINASMGDAALLNKFGFGLAPSVAIIIFCCARYKTHFSRALSAPLMIAAGEASYSIYLLHMYVIIAVSRVGGSAIHEAPESYAFLCLRLLFVLALIILISMGVHAFYEAPARRFLRNLVTQQKVLIPILIFLSPIVVSLALLQWKMTIRKGETTVSSGIHVVSSTYGANCGAPSGNATARVRGACEGQASCDYIVDVKKLGDPASGCGKSFSVNYRCPGNLDLLKKEIPAEAGMLSLIRISCPQ